MRVLCLRCSDCGKWFRIHPLHLKPGRKEEIIQNDRRLAAMFHGETLLWPLDPQCLEKGHLLVARALEPDLAILVEPQMLPGCRESSEKPLFWSLAI